MHFPHHKGALAELGMNLVEEFCAANKVPPPDMHVIPEREWHVNSCAYYRPGEIKLCLEHCGFPAPEVNSRNWTWPGSVVDREPYGVFAHELGHHVDVLVGERGGLDVWEYSSEYSTAMMKASGEAPLTSYAATNPAEWFAEAFRLYATNPDLLFMVRPKTRLLLDKSFVPVVRTNWLEALGTNAPARVVSSLRKKFVRRSKASMDPINLPPFPKTDPNIKPKGLYE